MKQEPYSYPDRQSPMNSPVSQKLQMFKTLFIGGWYALGNVLLLIGGDDTVEIGLKPHAIPLLTQPSFGLASDNTKGERI